MLKLENYLNKIMEGKGKESAFLFIRLRLFTVVFAKVSYEISIFKREKWQEALNIAKCNPMSMETS